MHPQDLRQYARIGALEQARRAVAEFPDILPELNQLANGHASNKVRRIFELGAKGHSAARIAKILNGEHARTSPLREELAARIEARVVPALKAPRRRRMSRAGRKAISDAMKARWAKWGGKRRPKAAKGGAR